MAVLEIIKWLYISWFCDKVFGWFVNHVNRSYNEAIEESADLKVTEVVITEDGELKKKKRTKHRTEQVAKKDEDQAQLNEDDHLKDELNKKTCFFGNALGAIKSSIFGGKVDLSGVHGEDWRKDPNVLSGLSRVDSIKDNGKIKVISYYDKNDKLVYAKEEVVPETDHLKRKQESFITGGSGGRFVNPAFFMKPRLKNEATPTVDKAIENIDKQLNTMFDTFGEDLPNCARATVDRHINDTMNDLSGFTVPLM